MGALRLAEYPWGKPGTASQFQRRELVAVPVLRRTHESGIFERVAGLRRIYSYVPQSG